MDVLCLQVRTQRAGVCGLDLGEVILGSAVRDREVRVLRQEAEVRQGVHLGPGVVRLVQARAWEDVVDFETAHLAKKIVLQRQASAPIPCLRHTGEHVQHRIELRSNTPRVEVTRFDPQSALSQPQFADQLVQIPAALLEDSEVLVDEALDRSRKAPPHPGLDEPEEQFVASLRIAMAALAVQKTNHDWDGELRK